MKILYIAHRIPYPPNKGDKIRSFHEIKYLSEFHEIHLAALVDNPDDYQYEKDLQKYCAKICLASIHPGTDRIKSLLSPICGKPLSVGYFYSGTLQKKIKQWLSQYSYGAVICFSSPVAEYLFASPAWKSWFPDGRRKTKKHRPELIMDFCDLDSDKWRQYSDKTLFPFSLLYRLEYKFLLAYEKKINRIFDRSVFISRQEAELFYTLYPKARSVCIIPNGVDHDYFSFRNPDLPVPEKKGPILLFTGAMDYYANADGVCWFCEEIFPLIRMRYSNARFYIVGSKPHPKVRELGKNPHVHVTGFVEDIRPYYEMADISVIPLRIARGVQNKVLEAMSMGKAIVTTPTAVQGISFDCSNAVQVAGTPSDFAESVLFFLENETIRQKYGNNARGFVKKYYDWQQNMQHLEECIRG